MNIVRLSDIPPEMFDMLDIYSRTYPVYIRKTYYRDIEKTDIAMGFEYNHETDDLIVNMLPKKKIIKNVRREGGNWSILYHSNQEGSR